jgi:hypothetical protein
MTDEKVLWRRLSGQPDQWFICLEHTTYLMEFSEECGPLFFRTPDLDPVVPLRNGRAGFLWEILEHWRESKTDTELSGE